MTLKKLTLLEPSWQKSTTYFRLKKLYKNVQITTTTKTKTFKMELIKKNQNLKTSLSKYSCHANVKNYSLHNNMSYHIVAKKITELVAFSYVSTNTFCRIPG